jgi:hypothetical protein
VKGATFRRVPAPSYDLPKTIKLSKKRLREIRMTTERQCRNGGAYDRPGITAAELLSLLQILEDERRARLEDIEDLTGAATSPGIVGKH